MRFALLISFCLIFSSIKLKAQLYPSISLFSQNNILFNPAIVGGHKGIVLGVMNRAQWLGVASGVKTQSIYMSVPFLNTKIGLGAYIIKERLGLVSNTLMRVCYAYRINFMGGKLSMGLKLGSVFSQVNFDNVMPQDSDDPLLSSTLNSKWTFNVGTGISYESNKLDLSMGIINLSPWTKKNINSEFFNYTNLISLLLNYKMNITNNLVLKPTVFSLFSQKNKVQNNIGVFLDERHTGQVGVFYRQENIWSFQAQINSNLFLPNILDKIQLCFAYDYSPNGLTSNNSLGYELMLRYTHYPFRNKEKILQSPVYVSPKYF